MTFKQIGIVGAGAMGRGIAQIAAQAGSKVFVFDQSEAARHAALKSVNEQWDRMVAKNRMSEEDAAGMRQRLTSVASLADLAACDLVIEAIVEDLGIKRALVKSLDEIVSAACVIATNTSSLSVTAIAAGSRHPSRVAGFHFFNPVPLMKVVEVIAGLKTAPQVCADLSDLAKRMGHAPVSANDTPGFIVNHAGRGFGTEGLRIVSEGIADFATIDAILRDQAGFKLGPFELMDLTALDVSHPVMESVYRQYFDEPRYRPSAITALRLAGGMLGKKVGDGFYAYADGKVVTPPQAIAPDASTLGDTPPVWVSAHAARRAPLLQLLKDLGANVESGSAPSPNALTIVSPLGLDITTAAILERLDPARTIGIDMLIDDAATRRRVISTNPATRLDMRNHAHALFERDGKPVSVIRDSAGFVTQRVLATIINIATDMCQQSVCSPSDLDLAVTLGLGYPRGPLAYGDYLGGANVLEVLMNMLTVYNDPRYRPSPWLRRRAALGLSLSHSEA